MSPYRIEISAAAKLELDALDRGTVRVLLAELSRCAVARARLSAGPTWDVDRLDALDLELETSGFSATVIVDAKHSVLYVVDLSRARTERTA